MNDRGSMGRTEQLTADEAGIARASDLLRAGRLVAFPTETVYGLGADATQAEAVAGIYEAKGRPRFNPLIAHVADLGAAQREGVFSPVALRLAEAFWPGPVTLVVPASASCGVSDLARAGLDSIGLRIPEHPVAQALLRQTGRPVAAPSANRSGHVSPTLAAHVLGDLEGRIAAVLDGGPARIGLESTILACLDDNIRLLRPGGITRDAIEALVGPLVSEAGEDSHAPLAPGMLESHYAPQAGVRLNADAVEAGEALLLFGAARPPGFETASAHLNLSETGDLVTAAANLFSFLRRLDATGAHTIAVSPIPEKGLGEAINDRLKRAAAAR